MGYICVPITEKSIKSCKVLKMAAFNRYNYNIVEKSVPLL